MSSFNIAARLTTRKAELIAQRGEHAQALEAFTEAIQLDPLYPNSYIGRALAYRRLENFPAAIEDERRAEELGGAEKTPWDRLVNRSRHHWQWDFDNPNWQRTDPLSRKAVLFVMLIRQIFNGGLQQWVANGYWRWIDDLIDAAKEVDTVATREVAAILQDLSRDLAAAPTDDSWNENDALDDPDDEFVAESPGLRRIYEFEQRYTLVQGQFVKDVEKWLEERAQNHVDIAP
jgi:tetratricopeptide (TPR) repeat protein